MMVRVGDKYVREGQRTTLIEVLRVDKKNYLVKILKGHNVGRRKLMPKWMLSGICKIWWKEGKAV